MTLIGLAKRAEQLLSDNSPAIMTAVGVSGTLVTAFLTGKATFEAAEVISYGEQGVRLGGRESFELKDKVRLVWKFYIPAAGTAALTVTAIILANRIGTRRTAAIAALYSISEKTFEQYKEKVVEKIGARKEQGVRDEIAQDRVNRNPPVDREVIITGGGDILCHDAFSGRYFKSDIEALRKAQNDLNFRVMNDYYASLSDFYHLIGLAATSNSDDVGWNSDKLMELQMSSVLTEDGRPCLSFDFNVTPIKNFYRVS